MGEDKLPEVAGPPEQLKGTEQRQGEQHRWRAQCEQRSWGGEFCLQIAVLQAGSG